MSALQVLVGGTIRPDGTLELDERPNLPPGRVQVVLRPEPPPGQARPSTLLETLEQIRREQEARGFKGRSREDIDASVRKLRDERPRRC